jgi:hypothetical protein
MDYSNHREGGRRYFVIFTCSGGHGYLIFKSSVRLVSRDSLAFGCIKMPEHGHLTLKTNAGIAASTVSVRLPQTSHGIGAQALPVNKKTALVRLWPKEQSSHCDPIIKVYFNLNSISGTTSILSSNPDCSLIPVFKGSNTEQGEQTTLPSPKPRRLLLSCHIGIFCYQEPRMLRRSFPARN